MSLFADCFLNVLETLKLAGHRGGQTPPAILLGGDKSSKDTQELQFARSERLLVIFCPSSCRR